MTFKAVQNNQKIWQIIDYAYVGLHNDFVAQTFTHRHANS